MPFKVPANSTAFHRKIQVRLKLDEAHTIDIGTFRLPDLCCFDFFEPFAKDDSLFDHVFSNTRHVDLPNNFTTVMIDEQWSHHVVKDTFDWITTKEMRFSEVGAGGDSPRDKSDKIQQALYERWMFADFLNGPAELFKFLEKGTAYQRAHLKLLMPKAFDCTLKETEVRLAIANDVNADSMLGLQRLVPYVIRPDGETCFGKHVVWNDNAQVFTHDQVRDLKLAELNAPVQGDQHEAAKRKMESDTIQKLLCKIGALGNVCVAGSGALAFFSEISSRFQPDSKKVMKANDIDLFMWGLTPEKATAKLLKILSILPGKSCVTGNAITVACKHKFDYYERPGRTIDHWTFRSTWQVVLRVYRSPSEILHGFDLPISKILMFPGVHEDHHWGEIPEPRFWGTASFIVSLNSMTLWTDPERQSLTYTIRLFKYMCKGMDVIVPGLDRCMLDSKLLYLTTKPLSERHGLEQLLVFEKDVLFNISKYFKHYPIATMPKFMRYMVCRYFKGVDCDYAFEDMTGFKYLRKNNSIFTMARNMSRFVRVWKTNLQELFRVRHNNAHLIQLDLKWVVNSPGSQVSGSFHPDDTPYYLAALGITSHVPDAEQEYYVAVEVKNPTW